MFISQVYKHSKWLCAAMILFVLLQLFINVKRGIVATPFLHYGMYSHSIKIERRYEVLEVKVNDKLLKGSDFTPQQWDRILLPLNFYIHLHVSNSLYENEVERLLGKFHISTQDQDFLQQCDFDSFEKWYNKYLKNVRNQPIHSCLVQLRVYQYKDARLMPADSVTNLARLCH